MTDEEQNLVPPEIVDAECFDLATIDLGWMEGQRVTAFSFSEPDQWHLSLSGGGSIFTQSAWRLLAADRMIVSSSDHGHSFGMSAPVDAEESARTETAGLAIAEVRIAEAAPDLLVQFANGWVLQILATSMGYECWIVRDAGCVCVVIHGNRTAGTWTDSSGS